MPMLAGVTERYLYIDARPAGGRGFGFSLPRSLLNSAIAAHSPAKWPPSAQAASPARAADGQSEIPARCCRCNGSASRQSPQAVPSSAAALIHPCTACVDVGRAARRWCVRATSTARRCAAFGSRNCHRDRARPDGGHDRAASARAAHPQEHDHRRPRCEGAHRSRTKFSRSACAFRAAPPSRAARSAGTPRAGFNPSSQRRWTALPNLSPSHATAPSTKSRMAARSASC